MNFTTEYVVLILQRFTNWKSRIEKLPAKRGRRFGKKDR